MTLSSYRAKSIYYSSTSPVYRIHKLDFSDLFTNHVMEYPMYSVFRHYLEDTQTLVYIQLCCLL